MSHDTTIASCCKGSSFLWSKLKRLVPTSSQRPQQITSKSSFILATLAASGLVIASAGFGAVYAWTTGSQHGIALGCLMVLMAVALEVAKPLSVSAAFSAFRSWALVRGAALALMATVAIGYSLQAELSLMATSRGDGIAQREAAIKATSSQDADIKRARERYDRAKAELDTLPLARPASALQAEIDGLLLTPGANACAKVDGQISVRVCKQVTSLRTEKAAAERRAELEQTLAAPLPAATASNSEQHGVGKADPGASALSTYLAFFGIVVPAAVLSEWLVGVGVIALEVGSAFAAVLVQSLSPRQSVNATQQVTAEPIRKDETEAPQISVPLVQVVQPHTSEGFEEPVAVREEVKKRIVGKLQESGGSVKGGERGLARLIGANRSTMRRAVNSLTMAGVLAVEATRYGTVLRLVS